MNNKKALFFCLISLFIGVTAHAQMAVLNTTLAGVAQAADFYADHLAADDNWIVVGAPREDFDFAGDGINAAQGDIDPGAVYIYQRTTSGPVLFQKIIGEGNNINPNSPGDRFGSGVVLQGDTLFVGVANDDNFPGLIDPTPAPQGNFFFAGQVYVFNFDTAANQWGLTQKLSSDTPNSFAAFGARTDSAHMELFSFGNGQPDPRIALIGEPENGSGLAPSLHVFKRKKNQNNWARVQTTGPPSGVAGALFADKIQRAGKFALVTESGISAVSDPVAVHAYRINPNGIVAVGGQLAPVQSLQAPGGPINPALCLGIFGDGMSAANGIAVISDPCDSSAAPQAGAVHIYSVENGNNNPLNLAQTLTSPVPLAGEFFGASFANGKQNIATNGQLIGIGSNQFGVAISPQQVQLYADDGSGFFGLVDSVVSPNIVVPAFDIYGQAVSLIGNNQLAISQMGLAGPGGQLFVFDIQ